LERITTLTPLDIYAPQLTSGSGAMAHSKQIQAKIAAVPVALKDEFESVQIIAPRNGS
jgi:hypothetical protein